MLVNSCSPCLILFQFEKHIFWIAVKYIVKIKEITISQCKYQQFVNNWHITHQTSFSLNGTYSFLNALKKYIFKKWLLANLLCRFASYSRKDYSLEPNFREGSLKKISQKSERTPNVNVDFKCFNWTKKKLVLKWFPKFKIFLFSNFPQIRSEEVAKKIKNFSHFLWNFFYWDPSLSKR